MQDEFGFIWELEEKHSSLLEQAIKLAREQHFKEAIKLIDNVVEEVEQLELPKDALYKSFSSPIEFIVASIRWELGELNWDKDKFKNLYWLPLPIALAYFLKAYILEEVEDIRGAIESLHKALEWNPIQAESYFELAFIFNNFLNEPREALQFCIKGLKNAYRAPVLGRGYNYLGDILMNIGDFDGAEAAYLKALIYNPDDERAKEQLELIGELKPMPSVDGTLESCDRILKERGLPTRIHSHFVQAFVVLGRTFLEGKDYESAVEQYNNAIEIDPEEPSAHAGLAVAYYNLGRIDLAKKHEEIALKLENKRKKQDDNL